MHESSLVSTRILSRPSLFDLSEAADRESVEKLIQERSVRIVNEYTSQLRELFLIDHPELLANPALPQQFEIYYAAVCAEKPEWQQGRWVYFPWIATLVHILPYEDFYRVRTARNRNLITTTEQERLHDTTIGIVGLSIGMSVALALALQGVARKIKLADYDTLELSNLNRIPSGVHMLGTPKVVNAAQQIYLLDPYADIELFLEGITESNITAFMKDLHIIIDESDSFAIKQLMRETAQKLRIPLVSGADVGDRALVSIERYDIAPDTKPFHGRIEVAYTDAKKMDKKTVGNLIARTVGLENHETRMLTWPKQLGQKDGLVSFPQLGGTALLNGAAVAYCVRSILLGKPVVNNQQSIAFDLAFLDPSHFVAERTAHEQAVGEFSHIFSSEALQ